MGLQKLLRQAGEIGAGLLDIVYPPVCLICGRADSPPLCEECAASFTPLSEPICPRCGRCVEEGSGHCRACAAAALAYGDWAFTSARTAAVFEGPLRQAIHRLKYNGCESLGGILGAYLANRVVVEDLLTPGERRRIEGIIAVPMAPSRERARGFNQARLIAEPLAGMLGVPLLERGVVRRTGRRPAQVGLSPERRRSNLAGAFEVRSDPRATAAIQGRHLLAIDDVFTTGATVHACAAALRDAGADSVYVVTLAGGG